jgi:hypothetical protein
VRSLALLIIVGCGQSAARPDHGDDGLPDEPDANVNVPDANVTAPPPDSSMDAPAADTRVPFGTPEHTWTWLDLPGTQCADGNPTGIGVNVSSDSHDVVVFFEGGGACWDATSCFVLRTAVHIDTDFNAATLQAELSYFPFDRSDTGSPLSRPTYIFVPYCTGDLHAGMRTATYDFFGPRQVHHVGATNTQLVVDRVHAALPDAAHVWVVGQSAGGYGATLNFHRFVAAWPGAELSLLQDSSPFIPVAANYGQWQASWLLQFPPNCTTCTTDFSAVIGAVHANSPTSRLGLLTFDNDTTIKLVFGYGLFDSVVAATNTLISTYYADSTTHVFELVGTDHTMLGGLATRVGPGGMHLSDWVNQWASDDPAWTSTR